MGADERQSSGSNSPDDGFEIIRDEARAVVTAQLETLRETDKKALATVRINAVLLGLLISAASLSENPQQVVNNWFVAGSGLLLFSLILGIISYSVDRPNYGIGPGYFDTVITEFNSQEEIQSDLLPRYADWIDHNSMEIATDNTYLTAAHVMLVLALLLLAVGALRLTGVV